MVRLSDLMFDQVVPVDIALREADDPRYAEAAAASGRGTQRARRLVEGFNAWQPPESRRPKYAPPQSEVDRLVADYLARGGAVTRCPSRTVEVEPLDDLYLDVPVPFEAADE